MKKILLLIFCLSSIIHLSQAQERGGRPGGKPGGGGPPEINVKGQIVDAITNAPLEFATISLFSKRDSSVVGGNLSDENGNFDIKATGFRMYAVIEFIGYERKLIDNVKLDKDQMRAGIREIDMGIIQLGQDGIELDEVEVRADKSETQFSLDKRVFNVGKDLANKGGTAQEILDNVPSVTVDIEGVVSLRGSTGVRILVNGRPSNLASADNANSLRQIPASMIEKIEVITNPSARYEAEGMSGIINIILKKEDRSGFNGSIDVSAGFPGNAGVGLNLNYRKGKINWFASYGLNYRTNPGTGLLYQELDARDTLFITNQTRDSERKSLSNTFRGGIDYYISEKETLTGAIQYKISDEDNFAEYVYNDYYETIDNLIGVSNRTDDEFENESGLEYSLNYRKEFSSRKHTLNITASYEDDLETEGSKLNEIFDSKIDIPDFNLEQQTNNSEGSKQWLAKADYVKPLGKDHQYEFGVRSSFRTITNDYLVEDKVGDVWIDDINISNNFIYNEDIYAAYAQYGNRLGKFSYQIGLRGEYGKIRTELKQNNEINNRDTFNLFPSAFLNYEINEGNKLQINYSRRIRRPRFWSLNPFFTLSDRRNFFSGNPNLNPEYTDSYELNYLKFWEKATFTSGIYYRHTKGAIERVRYVNDDGTTTMLPENLAEREDFGLEFIVSYSALKWLRLDANVNAFRSVTDGTNLDDSFEADAFTWRGSMSTKFSFWKSDLQIRTNYRAPRVTVQGKNKSITSIDVGWSKDFLKRKNATLTLSIRDLLNSRKRRYENFGDNFYREGEFQWRSRSINLNLNYRINQRKQRKRKGGFGGGGGEGEF